MEWVWCFWGFVVIWITLLYGFLLLIIIIIAVAVAVAVVHWS